MQLILQVTPYSSSSWYEKPVSGKKAKPGPRPAIDDTEALQLIKEDLKTSRFNGEGYLKVKKRLAKNHKHIAKHRVVRYRGGHKRLLLWPRGDGDTCSGRNYELFTNI